MLSLPIVVLPRIVTLLSRRQPAPIFTSGPMTQNGPTSTSSAISALGSTTACGEILGISSLNHLKVISDENQLGRLAIRARSFPFASFALAAALAAAPGSLGAATASDSLAGSPLGLGACSSIAHELSRIA